MSDPRSDETLRSAVTDELAWDALIDKPQLDVQVRDGVVTIVGTVGSYAEQLAIQAAVQAVEGVHDLVSELDVKLQAGTEPDDAELAHMVSQVLAWHALVPEQRVTVAVVDGWVTLGGQVAIAGQKNEAERAIGHLSGVRGVDNRISVDGPDLAPGDVHRAISEALSRRAAHLAAHIDVTVDGRAVTLEGSVQSHLEKRAILGAVTHAPGIEIVCDELRITPQG